MPSASAMSSFVASPLSSPASVAIIGGGFSGALLAAELLRRSAGRMRVVLIERNSRLGCGVAYGTRCSGHLLNVPAKDMSAFADEQEHFLHWVRSRCNPEAKGTDFLPRRLYGEYVQSILSSAADRCPGSFAHVEDEAVTLSCQDDLVRLHLRGGQTHLADKAVLALGNFPPADLPLVQSIRSSLRYVRDAWEPAALHSIAPSDEVLLIGSGLTSVDVLIALRASGHRGKIHFLSRHGLLPNAHQPTAPWPPLALGKASLTITELMRKVRMELVVASIRGYDWRAIIDGLRPATDKIWHSLPFHERRRFLRHLRPYWEIHRHRIAPRIAAQLEAEIAAGDVKIHAGRLVECREDADRIAVCWRDRRSGLVRQLRVEQVVNCTGPEMNYRRINSPLIQSLFGAGLARHDRLSLGLDCADNGALIGADGTISRALYAVGPARKGNLWESTAVPEIRIQVSTLAKALTAELSEGVAGFSSHPTPPNNVTMS